jgi:predicted phosphoribosyltransferase
MADKPYRDRRHAGRVLADRLDDYQGRDDVVVLALPRGGVPVAYEIAARLDAPMEVFLVRKLPAPGQPELAVGAIASGGVVVLNDDVLHALHLTEPDVAGIVQQERVELARRARAYRGTAAPPPAIAGKTAVIVDDGLATGASMRAAIAAARQLQPKHIVVAVPVAPPSTCETLSTIADAVVCAAIRTPFLAVGAAYDDFTQTTDAEVRELSEAALVREL